MKDCDSIILIQETILYTCRACGYQWSVLCLDATNKAGLTFIYEEDALSQELMDKLIEDYARE